MWNPTAHHESVGQNEHHANILIPNMSKTEEVQKGIYCKGEVYNIQKKENAYAATALNGQYDQCV